MPFYSYECKKCEEQFTEFHSIKEKLKDCPHCKTDSSLKKIFGEITTIKSKNSGKIVCHALQKSKEKRYKMGLNMAADLSLSFDYLEKPEKDIDIEIIGMRPGEKLHEIMVSDEESNFTCKKGKYYAIKPMLPELIQESYKASLKKEFSSSQNVLNLRETKKLLEKHKLLPGMNKPSEGGELLV